jgi:acyl carrier protein
MSTTIASSVRAFVDDTFYAAADLDDDASLGDTGTMDSSGAIELIAFLEKRWSITVGDTEIHPDNLDSVAKITAFVERKLGERSGAAPPCPPVAAAASGWPTPPSLEDHT